MLTLQLLILSVCAFQASFGQDEPTELAGSLPLLCLEPAEAGSCKALKLKFFYNVTSGQCETFNYGGCGGNTNRFDELEECQSACRAGVCTAVNCLMECASGFETDSSGCKLCSCRSTSSTPTNETAHGCPLIKCPPCSPGNEYVKDANDCDTCECQLAAIDCPPICAMHCELGMEKDSNGCSLCKCIEPTEAPKADCPLLASCTIFCPNGQQKDSNGCSICRCIDAVEPEGSNCTALLTCRISCPNGQAKDEDGCPLCQCIEPTEAPKADCPLLASCTIFCPNGQQKDSNGCTICRCNDLEVVPDCPLQPTCNINCPNGQRKDSKGCPLCECIDTVKAPVNCSLLPNCRMFCANGFQKGADGCSICKCIDIVETAENCSLAVNCNIFCPNGQAKDAEGCPLCKCIESTETVDCPLLPSCNINCPDGQEKDSQGCPICRCIDSQSTSNCPPLAVSCTMACEFGFTKTADGCRTCQCQGNPCENVACSVAERCRAELNETSGDYETRCIAAAGALPLLCLEPVDAGSCRALKLKFFYNVTSGQCETFIYGGCGGNTNRFDELEECQSACRAGICSGIQCAMACPDGFETDSVGCKVCRCRTNSEAVECPLVKCVPCPAGNEYKNDSNGCPTCECVNPREEKRPCPALGVACTIFCPNGQQKDSNGCTICRCNDLVVVPDCPLQPTCNINCPNGQRKDNNGCPLCECIDTVEAPVNCPLLPNCRMFCANGFQKDADGCSICKCIDIVETAENCSLAVNCNINCPNGQEKDSDGCPVCKCINEVEKNCPALVSCNIFCSNGQEKDGQGCPICRCKDSQSTSNCPDLVVSCTMACEFGFTKNADGCQICECQQDPCDLLVCSEEEKCITNTNEAGDVVAKCTPGRRWCFEGICRMYCENGFKSDQLGCPRCSCLDHAIDKCADISYCEKTCEFGHQRNEHGCRVCECLPNPCEDAECTEGTVCEALFFKGCPNCPAVAKCIDQSDVKRLYVILTYTHGRVRNLDVDKFALLVAKTLSSAIDLDTSVIFNVTVSPYPKQVKTLVTFHLISANIDLVATARKLQWVLDSDLTVVTFDLSGVTFLPDQATLTIMYYSNDDVELAEPLAAEEANNDDKVIIVSCLIGIAFFAICIIIMTVLYRRRRRREKANIIYKKAPTGDDRANSSEAKL